MEAILDPENLSEDPSTRDPAYACRKHPHDNNKIP